MTNEATQLLSLLQNSNDNNTLQRKDVKYLLDTGKYIDELRNNGYMIIGTPNGYYLTTDKETYVLYCQHNKDIAKRKVGKWHNRLQQIQQQEQTLNILK